MEMIVLYSFKKLQVASLFEKECDNCGIKASRVRVGQKDFIVEVTAVNHRFAEILCKEAVKFYK